jgi:hypothetical protein
MSTINAEDLVEIHLDKPRHLYLGSLRSLKALDRQMGEIGIGRVLELLRALNFSTLEKVIWAGLLHAEPDLKLSTVTRWVEDFTEAGNGTGPLFEAAYRAVDSSRVFGGPDRGNAKPEAVAQA